MPISIQDTSMAASAKSRIAKRNTASAFRWVFYVSLVAASASTAKTPKMKSSVAWIKITS